MRRGAWAALGAYAAIAVAATWPLALGLTRDVAWDLGDPLFVMWVLAWDCEQLLAVLSGDLARLTTFFDGNIFHPTPLTLTYSEHFVGQAVQVLPIYAVTGNPILCYNLLFLSTFALSGLGAYLFVRDLTGSRAAGFVAGLAFAFAPYRFPQASHLQVLSSQWMPFALYGFRRYFETRRVVPLIGAGLALVAQNLSCLYYLLYFSPVAAAYVLWEIVRRGVWRERRVWLHLAGLAVVVVALTAPFVVPYATARELFSVARGRDEVVLFSADVYSYATAHPLQPVWGPRLQAYMKAEGTLFPGFVVLALAATGLVTWRRSPGDAASPTRDESPTTQPRERSARAALSLLLAVAAIAHLVAAGVVIVERRVVADFGLFVFRMTNATQLLVRALVLVGVVLVVSRSARSRWLAFLDSRGFFVAALVTAVWLSLGPQPQVMGRPLNLFSPYALLYDYVPGFDGVRAPARLAMVAVLMLSVLAGFGAAVVARRRWGARALTLLSAAMLAEGLILPFRTNTVSPPPGYTMPESRVYPPSRAPMVYKRLAEEPASTVVVELPFGQPDYDLRAVYYSAVHWRRLVNGYSGYFPAHYYTLALALDKVPQQGDVAWSALRTAGATVVLVHEGVFLGSEGPDTSTALKQRGAVEIFRDGTDVLLRIPPGGI